MSVFGRLRYSECCFVMGVVFEITSLHLERQLPEPNNRQCVSSFIFSRAEMITNTTMNGLIANWTRELLIEALYLMLIHTIHKVKPA